VLTALRFATKRGVPVGGEQQAPADQWIEEPKIVGLVEQIDDGQKRIHSDIDEQMNEKAPTSFRRSRSPPAAQCAEAEAPSRGSKADAPAGKHPDEPDVVGMAIEIERGQPADHHHKNAEVDNECSHGGILALGQFLMPPAAEYITQNCEAGLGLGAVAQAEDVGGEIGELGLGQRNRRHRVLGQHDARSDGACCLSLAIGDLVKARNVGIGWRLLLRAANEMAIGAELFCQVLAVHRVRLRSHSS